MSLEATSDTPTPTPSEIEAPTQVQPARPPVGMIETPEAIRPGNEVRTHVEPVNPSGQMVVKTEQMFGNEPTLARLAELIVKEYRITKEADKISMKVGRRSIQAAIACGEFGNKAKELGKQTGEIPHGKWQKWVEENCEGVSEKTLEKWRRLATYNKHYPEEIAKCTNLKEAEQACGARSQTKVLPPPDEALPPVNGDGEPQPNLAEVYLGEIQRSFEHIQFKYDQLTEIDPELNSFLMKGYDNDFPLLLQMWQSSLSDAFAYFGLEEISNVCVRCGRVREWDEVFVPIPAYYPQSHQQRFNLWCQSCEATCRVKAPDVKELADNVTELKFLTITDERERAKEYTKAKKNDQLKHYKIEDANLIKSAQAAEWTPPVNEEEIIPALENLSPRIVFADTPKERQRWDIYRHFVSGAPYNALVGRQIKFFVVDGKEKVLGIGAISSDMMSLDERDTFIGWTLEQRHEENGKLGCIANGSVIVPTGLFGSNFFGGKLIASLTTCHVLRDKWKELYGDTLAGLSTTSLFGVPSMYDKVDEWKRLGKTKGAVPIEPSIELFEKWRQFLSETRTHEYKQILESSTNQKARILTAIYRAAGITDFEHGIARGLYFAEVYENTKDYLCSRINEGALKLKPLYAETVEQITDRWRKTAIKRYQKLKQEGRLRTARRSYGGQVGIEDMTDGE